MTRLRLAAGVVEGGVVAAWVLDSRLGRVETALLSEDDPVDLRLAAGDYFACLQLPDGNELIEPFTVEDSSETLIVGTERAAIRPNEGAQAPSQLSGPFWKFVGGGFRVRACCQGGL